MERKLFPVWLKSHLDRKSFIDRFGADLEWAFVSNQQADNAAGKRVDWLREQPVYSTNRNINEWTDQRLSYSRTPAAAYNTHSFGGCAQGQAYDGPDTSYKTEFLRHLRVSHPWHNWRFGCRQAWCLNCSTRLASRFKFAMIQALAAQPCPKSQVDLISLGVHVSHEFRFVGIRDGWKCRCGLVLKMHAREAAWMRPAKRCKVFR